MPDPKIKSKSDSKSASSKKKKSRKQKTRLELSDSVEPSSRTTTKISEDLQNAIKTRQSKSSVDENIAHMDQRLLADLFAQKIKRHHQKELTALEMNDLYLPTMAFRDTSGIGGTRGLDSLSVFLKDVTRGGEEALKKTCEEMGSPHTILVTSSGIRAADLTRALREFQTKDAMVAKLFAKHIKLDEAIKTVQKSRIGIGIGTPARIKDLLSKDALKTGNLSRIVIDGSHVDQKKRTIFDMKDLFDPLLDILRRPELFERYGTDTSKIEIIVY